MPASVPPGNTERESIVKRKKKKMYGLTLDCPHSTVIAGLRMQNNYSHAGNNPTHDII